MRNIEGKVFVLFGPVTFGYEKAIISHLERQGGIVYFRSDKPSENRFVKLLVRLFPKLVWPIADYIYSRWIESLSLGVVDYVLVIRGESLSTSFLSKLHSNYQTAVFCFYLWDSLDLVKGAREKLEIFDRSFSYDSVDCHYEENLIFRPLFYLEKFKLQNDQSVDVASPEEFKSIFFLGTLHSDRAGVMVSLLEQMPDNIEIDYWFFARWRWEYYLLYIFDKNVRKLSKDRIIFKPMIFDELKRRLSRCFAVVDIQHPANVGLTMRTFETIASNKKLITTNNSIVSYEFFDPRLIQVIDRKNVKIDSSFFVSTCTVDASFYDGYSLDCWLSDIFGLSKKVS